MTLVYFLSLYIHLVSAVLWFGSMAFFSLVMMPAYRKSSSIHELLSILRRLATRLKFLGWSCMGILLMSGLFNVWLRYTTGTLDYPFCWILIIKFCIFIALVGVSFLHDFFVGPRTLMLMEAHPGSRETQECRHRSRMLGRVNALLGLLMLALGIILVKK